MRTPLFRRIAAGCTVVLLLIAGYYWTQRVPARFPAPVSVADTGVTATDTVALAPDTSTIDTALTTREPSWKEPPVAVAVAAAPARTATPGQSANRPAPAPEEATPTTAAEKPAPPPCDQLVMRNGDLIEARILEIGVNEVRYKRCNREDGPDYVVSKSDALSIRFANGDVERFSR